MKKVRSKNIIKEIFLIVIAVIVEGRIMGDIYFIIFRFLIYVFFLIFYI